jgi:hypothetical protein
MKTSDSSSKLGRSGSSQENIRNFSRSGASLLVLTVRPREQTLYREQEGLLPRSPRNSNVFPANSLGPNPCTASQTWSSAAGATLYCLIYKVLIMR